MLTLPIFAQIKTGKQMIIYELLVQKIIDESNLTGSYDLLLKDDSFEQNLMEWAKEYKGIKTDRGFNCNQEGKATTFDIKFSFSDLTNRNLFKSFLESKDSKLNIKKMQYSV